ncbi:hypothetical protein DW928_05275 [Firmicutes bacterium AM43-11BH]|nr:hypothetical protein DW928_05275 [Firmicutes bacterium AM43-11BH]
MNNSIKPGQVWLDTEGKRIQAHGGSVICVEDTFYWYGENKENTTGQDKTWHWGVRCYSSKDLYNWKDEGIIIPPNLEDETSPLHPTSMMDRPHIVYNKMTQKYVAWLKIMNEPPCFTVLTADHILGPYKLKNARVNPCGMAVGDFDIAVEPVDNKAYLISERPHITLYVADLNDEYTDVTGNYSEHFPHTAPPETREAPAHFVRKGMHYLITSGTTGYHPNPSEIAVSKLWHGPYEILGNPHVGDTSKTSFNCQISSVFKHPMKKDLYIAIGDRWRPEIPELEGEKFITGEGYEETAQMFRTIFDQEAEFIFDENASKNLFINASIADYVWLPLRFDGDNVRIEWMDEWKIEEFE